MPMWYQWTPLAAGVLVMWLARDVPRAGLWVSLTIAAFVVSSLWWDHGGSMPAAFSAATDFIVALIMLKYARNKWEFYVLDCYGFMILVDIMWQFGSISSHYWYAISLEAANWAILLLVGAMGLAERLRGNGGLHHRRYNAGPLGLAYRHLVRKKRYPAWWRTLE